MKKLFLIFIILLLLSSYNLVADPFTMEFYEIVNQHRSDLDLIQLERSIALEKIALTYSEIIGEEGALDHNALTLFEFSKLCKNYGIENVIVQEILAYYVTGEPPLFVFEQFIASETHRNVLENENGRFIGANYINIHGRTYFTAYTILEKK